MFRADPEEALRLVRFDKKQSKTDPVFGPLFGQKSWQLPQRFF